MININIINFPLVNKTYFRVSETLLTQYAESTWNRREYYVDRSLSKSQQISGSFQRTFLDVIQWTKNRRHFDVLYSN